MTAVAAAPAAPPAPRRATRRRSRRWLRAVLPFAAVLALVAGTLIAHLIEQPDPTDASFLSPVSSAADGADRLAARLRDNRVAVERHTGTATALNATRSGAPATLFVTTPGLVHERYLRLLTLVPTGTRVVLVAPDDTMLTAAGIPVTVAGDRWAAAAAQPGCADPVAVAAGRAAVLRRTYDPGGTPALRCYADALVELHRNDAAVTLVGAADPFRNDRLDEHGNAAFAVGLLSRTSRVIWLDLHEREEPPGGDGPAGPPQRPAPEPGEEPDGDPGPQPGGEGGDPQQPPDGPENPADPLADSPLARAFPTQLWAVVLLVALAMIALAAASARRLGVPVAEPLPVRVRATETVQGHGRLYQRARARGPSLDALRFAARRRIAEQLGMPPDSSTDEVAYRAGAHTGLTPQQVREVLAGEAPGTNDELVAAALAVQQLVRDVTGPRPRPHVPDEGDAQ